MVHTFKVDNSYYIYDTASGSLHTCDDKTFAVIKKLNNQPCDIAISPSEFNSINQEIESLKEQGLLYGQEQVPQNFKKSGLVKALCLHICHDCNLRCSYCFADDGAYKGGRSKMSFDVAKRAVDFLIANSGNRKILEIDFFGGEPLMNFDVVKSTVLYAKEQAQKHDKVFLFTTTTNGLLLNGQAAEFLQAQMENVVLSLDGTPQTHNQVRKTVSGEGSFKFVEKNISNFVKARGDKSYYVRGTFTAKNANFAKDVLYLADSGYKNLSVEPVVVPEDSPLHLDDELIEIVNAEYESLVKEYIARIGTPKEFNFFHFNIDIEGGPCLSKRVSACGAGNEYFSVTPGGNIYPCHQFADNPKFCMGNVFDGNIDKNLREMFAKSSLFTKEECSNCFAKYHCSGGCAANNYNFCGDINKPYPQTCKMMKKRVECALHTLAKRKELE